MEKGEIDNLVMVGDLNPLFSEIGTPIRQVSSQWKAHTVGQLASQTSPDSPLPKERRHTSSQCPGGPCGVGRALGLTVSTHFTGLSAHKVHSATTGRVRSQEPGGHSQTWTLNSLRYNQWGKEGRLKTYFEMNENKNRPKLTKRREKRLR